jgi:hypothetical protein
MSSGPDGRRDTMPVLTGSIEADVPASFADREWREFIGRSVYDRFPDGYEDLRSSLADLDADDGLVTIADLGAGTARVSVQVEYTPHDPIDPGRDVARAQRELDRDLDKFRDFVLRRCDEELCRRN